MTKPLALGPHAVCAAGIPKLPAKDGVYLICFDAPISSANGRRVTRHYLGWASNIRRRIECHRTGASNSKFMQFVHASGVSWTVTHLWMSATRTDERRLKNQKHAWRLCPRCNPALRRPSRRKQGKQTELPDTPTAADPASHFTPHFTPHLTET